MKAIESVKFENIQKAAEVLKGHANHTPIATSRTLDRLSGANIFLKLENFQRVGAFKFRGAYHALSRLSDKQKLRGVITYSSGNHAQAIALAGRILGIKTTIVMPKNAPVTKRSATQEYGGAVTEYDPEETSREEIALDLQNTFGYTLVPPFDHPDIIAGQGTAALELVQELGSVDMLIAPCGGGGLLSGTAIAAKGLLPGCKVIGIEPQLADDAKRSFETKILHTVQNPPTIADGVRTRSLGKYTFPLVLEYVDDMVTVSEEDIMKAVQFLFYRMKLVVEPSGALGVAAILGKAVKPQGKTGVIISGGNLDAAMMTRILTTYI